VPEPRVAAGTPRRPRCGLGLALSDDAAAASGTSAQRSRRSARVGDAVEFAATLALLVAGLSGISSRGLSVTAAAFLVVAGLAVMIGAVLWWCEPSRWPRWRGAAVMTMFVAGMGAVGGGIALAMRELLRLVQAP
jgi:hypothetical protein